jgi:AraC-like DNA-binding protein
MTPAGDDSPTSRSRRSPDLLPPLPFGNGRARLDVDPAQLSALVASATGFDIDYRPAGDPQAFRHRALQIATPRMRIVAAASTPVDVRVAGGGEPALIVPTVGRFRSTIDGMALEWQANRTAALLPALPAEGHDGLRSGLWFQLDPQALEKLAGTMLGEPGPGQTARRRSRRILQFERPMVLDMRAGPTHFATLFRNLCATVDEYLDVPGLIERSNVEDQFARTIVMMLAPHRFFAGDYDQTERRLLTAAWLAEVCEFAMANLETRLTLTDIEAFSGFSARALQYAFRRRFGCTPQRWLLEQRLQAVHSALRSAEPGATVTGVAGRYFAHLGRFAQQYQRRFGEPPSATLARRR